MACAVVLPLAVASAGPAGDADRTVVRAPARATVRSSPHGTVRSSAHEEDAKARSAAPAGSPLLLGLGLATAVRCGPELTSPGGVEAQTCVLTQGEDTWARTYYRNVTGGALDSVLSLMGPEGDAVRMTCRLAADDEPGTCETPRRHTRGESSAYTAVAEFAGRAANDPLLLRAGSNSSGATGS